MCTALQHTESREGPEADLHLQNVGLVGTDLGEILSHELMKPNCSFAPWHSPPPLRCHILPKDFTCKSGLPCASPSSSLLPTWVLIKASAESVNSAGVGVGVCLLFQLAVDCTSQSTGEAGDLAPGLFQQLQRQGATGGISSSAACTPHLTNEQVFCLTPEAASLSEPPHVGPPFVISCCLLFLCGCTFPWKWSGSFLVWGNFATCRSAVRQLCSCECPQELNCHCTGLSGDWAHVCAGGLGSTQHLPGLNVCYGCILPHQYGLNSHHESCPALYQMLQSPNPIPGSQCLRKGMWIK